MIENNFEFGCSFLERYHYNPLTLSCKITTFGLTKYFKDKDETDVVEQASLYGQFYKEYISSIDTFISQSKDSHLDTAIALIVKTYLKKHLEISRHPYYILTGPLIYSIYSLVNTFDKTELSEIYRLLGQALNQTQSILEGEVAFNQQIKQRRGYTLLVLASINIQQQNFEQALCFLEEIERMYQIENNGLHCVLNYQIRQTEERWRSQEEWGMVESIFTLQALYYISINDQLNLQLSLKKIKLLQEHITDQELQRQIRLNLTLFESYCYLLMNKVCESKQKLETLNDDDLKEASLIFFNNPNRNCIRGLELAYSKYQCQVFHEMIKKLQEIEIQKNEVYKEDIQELIKIAQAYEGQEYIHGKLIILSQHVVLSYIARISKEYEKAIVYIKKAGFISSNVKLNPPHKVDFFMQYLLLLSNIQLKINRDSDLKADSNKVQYMGFEIFEKGGMSTIYKCKMKDHDTSTYLQKHNKQKTQKQIHLINEAALQKAVSHRHIQKVYDVRFVISTLNGLKEIILIQKKQGQDLQKLLSSEYVCFNDRIAFIFQILDSFVYLQALNILHCDLKLKNIVTHKYDKRKVKIIDFGVSQIQLIERYFSPLGWTKNFAPIEITKMKEKCSLDADIHLIGRLIESLLFFQEESDVAVIKKDEYKKENEQFLVSLQLKKLVREMINPNQAKRPPLTSAIKRFRIDMFILKIYQCITEQTGKSSRSEYQAFVDDFYKQFYYFLHYKYQSKHIKIELKDWSLNHFNFNPNFNIKQFKNAIVKLLSGDKYFVDCCFEEDVYNLARELISDDENQQQLDDEIQKLKTEYKEDDDKSQKDIHSDFIEIIQEQQEITQLKVLQDFKNYSSQLMTDIREYLKKLEEQLPSAPIQQEEETKLSSNNLNDELHTNEVVEQGLINRLGTNNKKNNFQKSNNSVKSDSLNTLRDNLNYKSNLLLKFNESETINKSEYSEQNMIRLSTNEIEVGEYHNKFSHSLLKQTNKSIKFDNKLKSSANLYSEDNLSQQFYAK